MNILTDVALPQVNVLGSTMAYREAGKCEAPVALFLHGNPTSSYVWRNVLPLVAPVAHCIAPRAGPSSSARLAFMEFIQPLPTWDDFYPGAIETFQKFRTQGVGEKMILEDNVFVEAVLPGATARKLTDEEMSVYRAPFPTPESRRPTWRFPNEIPIAGEPADVYLTLEKAHKALAESTYPKLLFAGNPGAIVSPAFAENFAKGLKNCRVVQLSSGLHYLQEDHPDVIGTTVKEWLIDVGIGPSPKQKAAV